MFTFFKLFYTSKSPKNSTKNFYLTNVEKTVNQRGSLQKGFLDIKMIALSFTMVLNLYKNMLEHLFVGSFERTG